MIQPEDTYHFHLGRSSYRRISIQGGLVLVGFLLCAIMALTLSKMLWGTYHHTFTFYLKWQDALLALLWFISFITLGGCVIVVRFLFALRSGYRKGMLTLVGQRALTVRDLVAENLASIFWMVASALGCFMGVLLGLLPEMLIGWTLHLSNIVLAVFATLLVGILGLAGLVISVVAGAFVIIGCIGALSFCRKLGAEQCYQLSNHTALRIDNFVLTIIYPGTPESMIDLRLLDMDHRRQLLAQLHTYWIDAQQVWNPTLGREIQVALGEAEENVVLV